MTNKETNIKVKIKKIAKEYVFPIFSVVALSFLFTTFVAKVIIVQGDSMNPNYENGEMGFSWVVHDFIEIKRGDVVSININENNKFIIKRIIGLPGEVVECRDNVIYVNGEPIEQDYLAEDTITNDFFIILEDDQYFALGDNRENSKDSRHYGPFTKEQFMTVGTLMLP